MGIFVVHGICSPAFERSSFDVFLHFRPSSCWLATLDGAQKFDFRKPMFWGFLVPVGLILICNVVLLVLTSLTTCRTDSKLRR